MTVLRLSNTVEVSGLVLALGALLACTVPPSAPSADASGNAAALRVEFAESRLEADLRELADDRYEGRNGGSEGERRAAQYLADRFRALGLEPAGDNGSYFQVFSFLPRHPVPGAASLESRNVLARFPGSGPAGDGRPVLIGGHYDGLGRRGEADPGRRESELARPSDEIWNAADDNASSIAVLLEVARRFATGESRAERDVVFCAFGAEEHGMAGSFHFVTVAEPLPVVMLNLEMPGRWPGEELMTAGFATSPLWPEVISRANDRQQRATVLALDLPEADTDHYPFFLHGIPAMTIGFPDGPLTHTAADEADDLSYDDLAWRSRYIAALLEEMTTAEAPVFSADLSRELRFAVVSTSPREIAEAGLEGATPALKVVASHPGCSDTVCIEPGDLIVEIDGRTVTEEDESSLHSMARDIPPGACLPLVILRDGARENLCL